MALSKELQDLVNSVGTTKPAEQQLNDVFSKYGQYTSGFSKPYTGYSTPVQKTKPEGGLGNFVRALGSQVAEGSLSGAKKIGSFILHTPQYMLDGVKPFLNSTAKVVTGNLTADIKNIESQRFQLDQNLERVVASYKSGKMSKANYNLALKQYGEDNARLSKGAKEIEDQLHKESSQIGISAANTAASILTVGRLKLGANVSSSVLRKTATMSASTKVKNQALRKIFVKNATELEKAVATIPAVRDLVYRNINYIGNREAQKLAGETVTQYIGREGKALAIGLLLKRPILYETNITGAKETLDKILEGDYDSAVKQAAWLSSQMLSGGPLGAVGRGAGWLRGHTRSLSYGDGSFIDEVSKQIGNKNANQIAQYLQKLKTSDPKAFQEAEKVLRIVQEANLQMADNQALGAANRVLQHWDEYGIQLSEVTPDKVVKLLKNWADANELKNILIQAGKFPGIKSTEAGRYVVVRWDKDARKALADKLSEAGNNYNKVVEAYQSWALAPGNAAAQNKILTDKIEKLINKAFEKNAPRNAVSDLIKQIRGLSAASIMTDIPEQYRKKFVALGFAIARPSTKGAKNAKITPAVNYEDTRKLITALENGDKEIFDVANAPQPQLNFFARALEKLGISPTETNDAANRTLSQQVVADLNAVDQARGLGFSMTPGKDTANAGRVILSKLKNFVEEMQPSGVGNLAVANRAVGPAVTDIRQLTANEVKQALGVTIEEARDIQRAIVSAYSKVPMEYRGAGPKLVDNLFKINPSGYLSYRSYSRIQSALRYTYNPFFRVQEGFETFALSRAQARSVLWLKPKAELDKGVRVLDESGIFKTGMSGESAQDLIIGRITSNLTQGQKRNLAGLGMAMAKSRNMSLEEMVKKYPDEIGDALRVVVQYPNKGVLNSSLARTLNVAFFPMRYNLKVTKLAAEILSREAPSTQLAVINSLFNMRDWLKSDEGIMWQSEHSEAIKVFNWLTPINSIEYGLSRLTRQPNSIGELGSLGGLPLGFITQMLDSQGIIKLNNPYVDPKSGDVLPKYIPETTKARAATALGDLLNSMFTYPGRTLGLPGKNASINKFVRTFIATNGADFEQKIRTEDLTPLQKNWVRVLKGDTSEEAIDALYMSPADGQFNWYTLPPLNLPFKVPEEAAAQVRAEVAKKTSDTKKPSAKKKKPVALPISTR